MKDITDLSNWKAIGPCTFAYKFSKNLGFLLIALDMDSIVDDLVSGRPFGFADLYVSSTYDIPNQKTKYLSELIVEDKTITFCMEVANSVSKEWEKEGLL